MIEKMNDAEQDMKVTVYRTQTGWTGYVTVDGDEDDMGDDRPTAEEAFQCVMRKYMSILDEMEEGAHCSTCNGSGEGMHDGQRCFDCKGWGTIKPNKPEDDE